MYGSYNLPHNNTSFKNAFESLLTFTPPPSDQWPFLETILSEPPLRCWITTEWMGVRGLQGVPCHFFFVSTLPKEKRFLGMSGMWRSNWHKSANLHCPPLPNHFIVLSGGNVALFARSHETSLLLAWGVSSRQRGRSGNILLRGISGDETPLLKHKQMIFAELSNGEDSSLAGWYAGVVDVHFLWQKKTWN